jgi:hypothetical protein
MSKERIKGIIIGFILCAVLSASIMIVGAETAARNIIYGVGVILNGQQVHFDRDSRPFTMDGRTFLPLRTLAEMLDLPVDFDPVTNTAILGYANVDVPTAASPTPTPQPPQDIQQLILTTTDERGCNMGYGGSSVRIYEFAPGLSNVVVVCQDAFADFFGLEFSSVIVEENWPGELRFRLNFSGTNRVTGTNTNVAVDLDSPVVYINGEAHDIATLLGQPNLAGVIDFDFVYAIGHRRFLPVSIFADAFGIPYSFRDGVLTLGGLQPSPQPTPQPTPQPNVSGGVVVSEFKIEHLGVLGEGLSLAMIIARGFTDPLGLELSWNEAARAINIIGANKTTGINTTVTLVADTSNIIINGETHDVATFLGRPALAGSIRNTYIIDDRTCIPVSLLAAAFGIPVRFERGALILG